MSKLRQSSIKIIRKLVHRLDGVLLSQKSYEHLIEQRAEAVRQLTHFNSENLKVGLTGVIFSKDRALQLYSLLYTYFKLVKNPAPLFIIYNASTTTHEKSYREIAELLHAQNLDVKMINEAPSFRETLLKVLSIMTTKNIFFLVDDIIFIRPVDLDIGRHLDPQKQILSLRHSPHLRYSYTTGEQQMPPKFLGDPTNPNEPLQFNWFEMGNEWSDPWSVDGQILSLAEVKTLSSICSYKAPNTYEGALKGFNDLTLHRQGLCFSESKILNLPINRIQNEVENRSGNISPEFLLEKWNLGEMLNVSIFENHIPKSPHEEHALGFIPRSNLEFRR